MNARRLTLFTSTFLALGSVLAACGDDTGSGGTGGAATTGATTSTGASTKTTSATSTSSTGGMTTTASGSGSTGSADASSSTGSGSSSTGGGPTATFAVTIRDAQSQLGIAGLDVCENGAMPANCQVTDATGLANLTVPAGVDFVIRYSNASYRPHLLRVRADADLTIFTLGISNTTAGLIFTLLGETDDPQKGQIGGLVTDGMMATSGAVAALSPNSGAGPFYTQGGIPSTTPTQTSADGLFLFLNVDPGNPEVSISKTGTTCTPQIGVVGGTPSSTVVPIEAGAFTVASSFDCL